MAKAMVSTRVGVEGLPVVPDEHLLVADEPEKFASAVVRLLNDVPTRQRIGQAARRLVESRFGWPQVTQSFYDTLAHVVKQNLRQTSSTPPPQAPEYALDR